jgi:iron complex outermembrane receptor protein
VLHQTRSDWIDNKHTGEDDALGGYDTTAYRLQLLWEPTERFNALLNVHGWELDGTARVFRANIIKPGTNDLIGGFEPDEIYHDGRNKQEIDAQGGVLRMEYDLGPATLTSVTGFETLEMYSRGDIDGGYGAVFAPPSGPGLIPFPSETADGIPDLDQLTQEIRLSSNGDDRLSWIAGVFYFDEELQADTYSYATLAPDSPQDGFSFQTQEAKAWALFASLDYEATEKWDLKAGIRFSSDEKDFSAERPWPTFNTPTVAPIVRETDDDFTSWNLSAVYKASPTLNLFGRVATGFRAPSIQGRILFCADFAGGTDPATNCVSMADTEEIISFEAGFKSILADHRLRLNMTAYKYEVDGQQVTAVGGEYNTATLLNVDKTEGYGLEADIELTPTGNWLMTFGASYNPTKIRDKNLAVAPCGGGCTVTDPIGPNGALVDGNSLPHAPDLIFNGIINYRSDAVNKGFFATLDWSYYSEKSFFLYESEEFKSDAFEVGLRLGYAWHRTQYEVALFARNLTDETIVRNAIDFNNLTGMINDPRVIGVELVGRF